eukprot:scaffold87256_cov70-Phaeocystis_antarctica.AAC.3
MKPREDESQLLSTQRRYRGACRPSSVRLISGSRTPLAAHAANCPCAQVHFPSWLPFFPTALTRGELIAALAFLVLNLAVLAARVHRSLGRGAKKLVFLYEKSTEPIPAISFQALEVWALTIGILAILNMGWYLMLPIARRSVLLEIMGVSWECAGRVRTSHTRFLAWSAYRVTIHTSLPPGAS